MFSCALPVRSRLNHSCCSVNYWTNNMLEKVNFIQHLTIKNLLVKFKSVIITEKFDPSAGKFHLRCVVRNIEECNYWVLAFSETTNTQWKVRRSKLNGSVGIVCQKLLLCHHSAYQKRPIIDEKNNNKRDRSKNTDCSVQLSISVNVTTPYTK